MKRSASMTGNENKKQKPAEPIELESMDTSQTMDTAESAHDTSLGSRTPLGPLSSLRLHWPIRAGMWASERGICDCPTQTMHARTLRFYVGFAWCGSLFVAQPRWARGSPNMAPHARRPRPIGAIYSAPFA